MGHLLAIATFAVYATATLWYARGALAYGGGRGVTAKRGLRPVALVSGKRERTTQGQVPFWLLLVGFLFCSATLGQFMFSAEFMFLANAADYFMWLSWLFTLALLLLYRSFLTPLLGAMICPVVVLLLTSSSLLAHGDPIGQTPMNTVSGVLLLFHVFPVVVAEACLLLCALLSAVVLIQDYRLRRKKNPALLFQGPSLRSVSELTSKVTHFGFIAITFGILVAPVLTLLQGRPLLRIDLLQLSGFLSWGCFGLMMYWQSATCTTTGASILNAPWSNRRVATMYLVMSLCFFAAILVLRVMIGVPVHPGEGGL